MLSYYIILFIPKSSVLLFCHMIVWQWEWHMWPFCDRCHLCFVTCVTIIHNIILYLLFMFKIKNKEKKNKVKFIANNSDTNSVAKWHTLLSSSGFPLLKFLSSNLRYVTYITSRGAVYKLKPKVAPICLPHSQMMHKYFF